MNKAMKTGEKRHLRVCIISFPMPSFWVIDIFLYDLIKIFEPLCDKLFVVGGRNAKVTNFSEKIKLINIKTAMHYRETIYPKWWSLVLQCFKITTIQIKICWILMKLSKKIDVVFFYVGGANLFLPVIMAKILRKHVITSAIGLGSLSYKRSRNGKFFGKTANVYATTLDVLETAIFNFSDLIIAESPSAVNFLGLNKYRQKVLVSGARYIDTKLFRIKKEYIQRMNLIGYIGRLDEGKGVMNFVRAMPLILEKQSNLKFFIGGCGTLAEIIKEELKNNNLSQRVELVGWIPHDKVTNYLNEMKLFVLPSYSEGLPTVVLEAMACGTPVLATPVGGIPDVIKDDETGFILQDNSPECIAKTIVRVFQYKNVDRIINNARELIQNNYTYDAAIERYRKILFIH
ncbi:MAG TPA: glycosyltransferase family 1 protein [Proteobacteria bacterium]|nr:glycosyltransferase family 1 protein [Pseudomonadota bacterium]